MRSRLFPPPAPSSVAAVTDLAAIYPGYLGRESHKEPANQTDNRAGITDLKDKWDRLNDVDRACAVHKIHKAGTSLRDLAKPSIEVPP